MSRTPPIDKLSDELRKSAEELFRATSEPEEMRKGVLLFVAYALEAVSELSRFKNEHIAGWLTARTLWHNAGCLALFLLDDQGHRDIVQLLDYDNDQRAERLFIGEVERILGKREAAKLFDSAGIDRKQIQERAKTARENTSPSQGWDRIGTKELEKALRRMCESWSSSNKDAVATLTEFMIQSDIARTRGDMLAHPNVFGVQTLVGCVDLTDGRVLLGPDRRIADATLLEIVAFQLLVLHAAAFAMRFPQFLDLAKLLTQLSELSEPQDHDVD